MKKCSSCTKDLPDAALHCVFCGAKQVAAPIGGQPLAKTVMGYSQADMIEQLKAAGKPIPPALLASQPAPVAPAPLPPAPLPPAPLPPAPLPAPPPASPSPYDGGMRPATPSSPPPLGVPIAGAQAKTMFVDGPPPAVNQAAVNSTLVAPPASNPIAAPMPQPSYQPTPVAQAPQPVGQWTPTPVAQQPAGTAVPSYMNTAGQADRPIDPWKDGLRLQMFLWGGLLLIAFLLPLSTRGSLKFSWDLIADAPGKLKIMPLVIASAGLLSIVFAAMPLASVARGSLALVLGLAGIVTPLVIAGAPSWQSAAYDVGMMAILIGLLLRSQYQSSILPRILVTVGVLAALAPSLVPTDHGVPIVATFTQIVDGRFEIKVMSIAVVVFLLLKLMTLLVWLPSPGSAGSQVWLWLLIGWPVVSFILTLVITGAIGNIPDAPAVAGFWITGPPVGGELPLSLMGIPAAFGVLVAYGGAVTLGKTLE